MPRRMTDEQLYKKYGSRILAILNAIREAAINEGFECDEPWEMSDEEFEWWMLIKRGDDENENIDVRITILESEVNDGEKGGVNFSLQVNKYGGQMVGRCTPYNYTDDVWVSRRDYAAVEERFKMFEQACDPATIIDSIRNE